MRNISKALVAAAAISVATFTVQDERGNERYDDNYVPRWKRGKRSLRRQGAKLRRNMNTVSKRVRRKHRRAK